MKLCDPGGTPRLPDGQARLTVGQAGREPTTNGIFND
jgi:hypothetical protein